MGNPPFSAWAVEPPPGAGWPPSPTRRPQAELVVNATNGAACPRRPWSGRVPSNLAGKVLIDIANPLDFSHGFPPTLFVKDTDSLGEQIQRAFPQARVVKTLNTLTAALMVDPDLLGGGVHASSSPATTPTAKATVTDLLKELRAHRRHRPRRHQHRPRHRDAAAGLAAADGRPGHPDVQLQDRPLIDGHA